MRRTNRAFIPTTLLLVIQIVITLALDKILLDQLSVGEDSVFREQYGITATFFMFLSLLVVFCCVALFFEKTIIKYIFMLLMTIGLTVVGIGLNSPVYLIPIIIAIVAFISFLIADNYVKKGNKPYVSSGNIE